MYAIRSYYGTFISVGITLVEDYLLDGTINTDSSEYYTSAAQGAEAGVKTGLASAIVGYRLPNDFKCGPYK